MYHPVETPPIGHSPAHPARKVNDRCIRSDFWASVGFQPCSAATLIAVILAWVSVVAIGYDCDVQYSVR